MKILKSLVFSVLFVLVAMSTVASALPVSIVETEIDDTKIAPFGENVLDIMRNGEFELELDLLSPEDVKDIEIRAFVSGYEHNDIDSISDRIGPLDLDANVTYVKRMHLSLPDDVEKDDYKLRLILSDRFGDEVIYTYEFRVNSERHELKIEDVVLSPGSQVKAGQALLSVVRLENKGQKDEEDVRVSVSIPALGVSAVDYIDEVEEDEEEETEELFLRLPRCADAGVYDLTVEVSYNDGHDQVTESMQIAVLENDACAPEPAPVVVVEEATQEATEETTAEDASKGQIRSVLEVILLVLVALLVIVGLIIGFTRMRNDE